MHYKYSLLICLLAAAMLLCACAAPASPKTTAAAAPTALPEAAASVPAPEESEAPAAEASAPTNFAPTPYKDDYAPAQLELLSEQTPYSFDTLTLEGRVESSKTLFSKAKLTVITCWGTTCGYCIQEMPVWDKLAKEYAGSGVQFVGICTDVNDDAPNVDIMLPVAQDLVKQTGAEYVQLRSNIAIGNTVFDGLMALPTTVFVDGEGRKVCSNIVGAVGEANWIGIIETLMHEMA